jgi:hypothetical protein
MDAHKFSYQFSYKPEISNVCRTLFTASLLSKILKMYICGGASFLSGIRHKINGEGTGVNRWPFVYGDAEFRVSGIRVPATRGLLP